jgi:hypothetical protein
MFAVKLDEDEIGVASHLAGLRHIRAIRENMKKGHGEEDRRWWDREVHGMMAEMAVAKAVQVYWMGKRDDFGKQGDVMGLEVRGTPHEWGHLIIYANDVPNRPHVLVIVRRTECVVLGWKYPADSHDPDWYKAENEVRAGSPEQWWVPWKETVPIETAEELETLAYSHNRK